MKANVPMGARRRGPVTQRVAGNRKDRDPEIIRAEAGVAAVRVENVSAASVVPADTSATLADFEARIDALENPPPP